MFCKIYFPATFGGLLEFLRYLNLCVKHKNIFISETEQDTVISTKFLTHRVSDFWQPSSISALNAECLFISETERDQAIVTKFLIHRVSAGLLATFRKNCFPATFGVHLEFLTRVVSAEYTGNFSQKLFSRHFWWPS